MTCKVNDRRMAQGLAAMIVLGGMLPALADVLPVLPLADHHANYKLSLVQSTGTKAPQAVDGLMSYDFTGSACDGYAMTLRQMTALQPQEGDARVSDMQTASFEDGAAREYRFKVATKGDAGPDSDVDGSAHRGSNGVVSVALQQPDAEKLNLSADVLFPTEHLRKIIATARDGGKLLSAEVFDGSETGKKVFQTLTVIGALNSGVAAEPAAQPLKGIRHWPVTISYFDAAKADGAPDYVLTFDLYENGVSRALRLDYGDFVLAGELTDLKLLPDSACAK